MKKLRYPFLLGTMVVLSFVITLFALHLASAMEALALLVIGQLAISCFAQPRPALFMAVITREQGEEFKEVLDGLKDSNILERLKTQEKMIDDLRNQVRTFRKGAINGSGTGVYQIGKKSFVTNDCADALAATLVVQLSGIENGLEHMISDAGTRERVLGKAKGILGVQQRTALDSTTTPLPTVYVPQVIELVFKFGQARQYATVYPLGAGTVKLPRLKVGEDEFGYFGAGTAGMSQNITEKQVQAELVTFTANKAGGLVRFPTEIEEDTFIPIGQFLARYIARQLAKLEDKTLFLADGTGTYAGQTGVGKYCDNNATYRLQLAAGKTAPSDTTLDDLRNLRSKVSAAVLAGGYDTAYYMNPTWEPFLRSLNRYPNFVVFDRNPATGEWMFDGWPVRWVGVIQNYQTAAAASSYLAFFGALEFWYLGERGSPRVEVSREVFFATDELAMRALERIDVEVMGVDAMATLKTAAA